MTSNPDVPPFIGYVETTVNALRLIHAARQGVIPRITRRLNDSERRTMIKSGAVFVFSVEESGIKRWTDGLLWSPSRIVGNFLVYREINERSSSRGGNKKPYPSEGSASPTRTLARRSSPDQMSSGFRGHPTPSHGASDQGTFKPNGLIKKTITVTVEGSDLHLISYYTSEDIRSGKLKRPSSRPDIMSLHMPPHIFRLTNFRVPPKVEIGSDGKPRLVCEAEDPEPVDCKVEDQQHHVPPSPTWAGSMGHNSPLENPFAGNSLYPLTPAHNIGNDTYNRGSNRWHLPGDNSISTAAGWSSSSNVQSFHGMSHRRDTGMLSPAESWPSVQSARWHGHSHDSSTNNVPYPERSRLRTTHPYEDVAIAQRREKVEAMSPTFGHRYPAHVASRREATQRLQWHPRDSSEGSKDRRPSPHSATSFSPSPTLPFTPQTYHPSTQSYSSTWTSGDTNVISSPTLHTMPSQAGMSYDIPYHSVSRPLSSPEEFTDVEEFGDA